MRFLLSAMQVFEPTALTINSSDVELVGIACLFFGGYKGFLPAEFPAMLLVFAGNRIAAAGRASYKPDRLPAIIWVRGKDKKELYDSLGI